MLNKIENECLFCKNLTRFKNFTLLIWFFDEYIKAPATLNREIGNCYKTLSKILLDRNQRHLPYEKNR